MSIAPGPETLPAGQAALIVLDGWGLADAGPGNAVSLAETPVFDELWSSYPTTTLTASGRAGCRTVRIVAPATTLPSRNSRGTEPGAAIRARAVRTWCRHCRWSNAAGALGARPPLPVSIA